MIGGMIFLTSFFFLAKSVTFSNMQTRCLAKKYGWKICLHVGLHARFTYMFTQVFTYEGLHHTQLQTNDKLGTQNWFLTLNLTSWDLSVRFLSIRYPELYFSFQIWVYGNPIKKSSVCMYWLSMPFNFLPSPFEGERSH